MSREAHAGFYERRGVRLPPATHLVILCRSRAQAEAALHQLRVLLAELGLELAEAKTRLVCLDEEGEGFDFLGFHHRMVNSFSKPGVRFLARWPSAPATQAARTRIRELTERRLLMLPIEEVVGNLNRFLVGWGNYFRWGNSTRQFDKIDRYAIDRVARLLAERHRRRRRLVHGRGILFADRPDLMPRRLSGTVRYYRSAYAAR